jgi:hypothetical protein
MFAHHTIIETTLKFVIDEARAKHITTLSTAAFLEILNGNPCSKNSLVAKAANYGLVRGLAFLLSRGATLGPGLTPAKVYHDAEVFNQSLAPGLKKFWYGRSRVIRDLLDRSKALSPEVFCNTSLFCQFNMMLLGRDEGEKRCLNSLPENPAAWEKLVKRVRVIRVHVPSTDVSLHTI